jgi:carbamate kinase
MYEHAEAERLAVQRRWKIARDGQGWRRVVPSPEPTEIVELAAVHHLATAGFMVICAGGGGVPVQRTASGKLEGAECVVDKDLAAALLGTHLGADCLMLLTDVPAVFDGWGTGNARRIRSAHPDALGEFGFPAGTMGSKVEAARRFATHTGGRAYIGAITDADALLECRMGTCVSLDVGGISYAPGPDEAVHERRAG